MTGMFGGACNADGCPAMEEGCSQSTPQFAPTFKASASPQNKIATAAVISTRSIRALSRVKSRIETKNGASGAHDSPAEAFLTVSRRSGIDVGTTDGESAVERHSSSAPQRITKVMGKPRSCQARRPPASGRTCSNPRRRNSRASTRARELMRSSTVKDNLAITRHWCSLVGIIALSKPLRIDAHRAGNALMASRTIPAAV